MMTNLPASLPRHRPPSTLRQLLTTAQVPPLPEQALLLPFPFTGHSRPTQPQLLGLP
jgi:hypothetical protein